MAIAMLFCHLFTEIIGLGENMKTTTVDRFGRIVLPKKLRDNFSLEPGSQIQIACSFD